MTLIGLVCLCVAFVFGFFDRPLTGNASIGPSRDSEQFVFADLDGDLKPDMAMVEMQNQRSADVNYSIHVKLEAGEESAIGVNGPEGGLRLAARDVNGDDTVDLVVTSNLDANFIEVLLNDGHGNFRFAKPDEFPQLGAVADSVLAAAGSSQIDQASIECVRTSLDMDIVRANDFGHLFSSSSQPPSVIGQVLWGTTALPLGRSPPVPVLS